jgi:putative transposase
MPRPPRVQGAGAFFHVTAQGNDERAIFVDDADRKAFLDRLASLIVKYEWRCHSYCLMTNHFHLLLDLAEENLDCGMSELLGQHARRFNRRYGRKGHLFGKRYAAELVAREAHFLETLRYIDMNPVRAGICPRPAHWRWGSYRFYAGLDAAQAYLHMDVVLGAFGGGPLAGTRYVDFVAQGEFAVAS